MSNIIDSIQLSGTTYQIQGSGGGGVPESAFTAYTAATDARIAEDEEVTAAALNDLNERISGISGNNVVEVTQAQYDALVSGGTVDPTAFYIITDATAGDLTNYYTKSETNTLLNGKQATLVSGTNIKTINNESILGSGNIDIQGGSTYTAGRGISIANDTISFSLPISAGTGTNSVIIGGTSINNGNNNLVVGSDNNISSGSRSLVVGYRCSRSGDGGATIGWNSATRGDFSIALGEYCTASAKSSFARGSYNNALTDYSFASGYYIMANNNSEHSCGQYNVSNTGSTDADKTLFSVGNGTDRNARHNAFEIRKNGDIYLSLNGQDVKLQDQLGGGSITVDTALDSGSTNPVENRVIYNKFDEVEQVTAAALNNINDRLSEDEEVTAAGLNAVNDKFDGLKLKKLTQAEYDALTTKDSNTLYIVI